MTDLNQVNIFKVSVKKNTVIPPNSMKYIKVKTNIPSTNTLVIQPSHNIQGILYPSSVVNPEMPYLQIRNMTDKYLTIKKKCTLGVGIEVDEISDLSDDDDDDGGHTDDDKSDFTVHVKRVQKEHMKNSHSENNRNAFPEHLGDLLKRSTSKLSKKESEEVESLLENFQDVFARNDFDLGQFNGNIKHKIDTGTAKPIKQKLRRTPMGFEEEEEKHIQQMLEKGIIRPSSSEWSSPSVLIRKKDGSLRFCIDYRALNKVTFKDAFPIPNLKDCIDTLRGNIFF